MPNFTPYLPHPQLAPFAAIAEAAEKILPIDPAASILNCRRGMEAAVKWMYSVDEALTLPVDTRLAGLMGTRDFRDVVGADLWQRLRLVRILGNDAAHGGKKLTQNQAVVCLENLFAFFDFLACCYGQEYTPRSFDPALLPAEPPAKAPTAPAAEVELERLMAENQALREELTARRTRQQPRYVTKPLELSEYNTRKIYIDAMLLDAGWVKGKDWLEEVPIHGMPSKSGVGYTDYLLCGQDGRPLAVVEAKRSCADPAKGRQQAELYADQLEKKYGRRPVVFLTNGFESRILDGRYPERQVAAIWSRRDLEKLMNLRGMRESLDAAEADPKIAGRYYQKEAVRAVCDSFDRGNRRKALLVMATGSGKTRTVIALCDVLLRRGWVKNILFLADRNSLVTQAKRSFVNLLPNLSVTNLCEEKDNTAACCVFSTYQTMMGCIDSTQDDEGRVFTCGHFDLVICDEAHRSIYNKYRDIFHWFDAPLVGLTATPKDEIDKNTYEVFELGSGDPTYGYELAQAVRDGFLVDFVSAETSLKFLQEGIVYDDLSDEDKAAYEETFGQDGEAPDRIASTALNEWVFNEDTILKVLDTLMTYGLRVDYGSRIGKTILFAKNHRHAQLILELFGKRYPELPGYAKVIDNTLGDYAQSAIDQFSQPGKPPYIAISVDMLDTGIDVPEVLNLVFFKRVLSKAKFWQMIGRGTRLCPGLLDGKDKEKFYIFDFCGNFEFFRMGKEKVSAAQLPIQGALFRLKAEIAMELQGAAYQKEELTAFRRSLVEELAGRVRGLNRESFAVRQHLRPVERFSTLDGYNPLNYQDILTIGEELAPLLPPEEDDPRTLRFDALLYGIQLAHLAGRSWTRARNDLCRRVGAIAAIANIPEIAAQKPMLEKILHTTYLDTAGPGDFEDIRQTLRGLMRYLTRTDNTYLTNFNDEILSVEWEESQLENDDLVNYKVRAEFYLRQHQDKAVIAKVRGNQPVTPADIDALEDILWSEVGSQEEYESACGQKPLGEFVREIVGLDMKAAKAAFGEYLNGAGLDSRQMYFVNQIVEYIVQNGMMKDFSVLQTAPFTDQGSVAEVFTDMSVWLGIQAVIQKINANVLAA